ncbi:DUF262 domain-containing protein [Hymenobacter sp. UYCo722]|uniref:DUF262 domain-containing protein n=1 Tax=Hymenobacter sp. UYCo722 TaxID=3156335 RepID=UPI003397D925
MPSQYSFWQLLTDNKLSIKQLAIPLLQRDYAQGRSSPTIKQVREEFVKALRGAFPGVDGAVGLPLGLDFVYGTEAGGVLTPLDGQQRLTTLFLLHWYLATGAAGLDEVPQEERDTLRKFSYEVRAAARDFCAELANCPRRPTGTGRLSATLAEAAWFRLAWHRDPTVSGMLTMLDELDKQFKNLPDPTATWADLKGTVAPLTFQFLNLGTLHLTDDLYTRMNARGKALTRFENWKARFDEFLHEQHPAKAASFAEQMDGDWTDFFWQNRLSNASLTDPAQAVDGPFRTYLNFVTRMLWLRDLPGTAKSSDLTTEPSFARYEAVYSKPENLDFLILSLNALATVSRTVGSMDAFFAKLLTADNTADGRVRFFADWNAHAEATDCNLFSACCQFEKPGPMAETLFFVVLTYAVRYGGQLNAETNLSDLRDLLRVVRNRMLQEQSIDLYTVSWNVKSEYLANYLRTISFLLPNDKTPQNPYCLLAAPDCPAETPRLDNEREKARLLVKQPELQYSTWKKALQQLEDNSALRGMLHNIDLTGNAQELAETAEAVASIWPDTAANDPKALIIRAGLTVADYSVKDRKWRWFFGGHGHGYQKTNGWIAVLTTDDQESSKRVKDWLSRFLPAYQQTAGSGSREARLKTMIDKVDEDSLCELPIWQRHFIRYANMVLSSAEKNWGIQRSYFVWGSENMCQQLSKTTLNGWHINPYIRATALKIPQLCDEQACYATGDDNGKLSYGPLAGKSGVCLRLDEDGWQLHLPESLLPLTGVWAQLPERLRQEFTMVEVVDTPTQWRMSQPDEWDLVKTGVAISEAIALSVGAA